MPTLTEARPHRRSSLERFKSARLRTKRAVLPKHGRSIRAKLADRSRSRAMKRGNLAGRIAALAASCETPATLADGTLLKHPPAYIAAVVETAAYVAAEGGTLDATGPREFAKHFLDRDPQETNSPTGLAAVLFEAYLIQNEETLYGQFLETFLEPGDKTFLAVFEGPISRDQLVRLTESVKGFLDTTVLVRYGDHSVHEVSDLTILECQPLPEGLKAMGQTPKPAAGDGLAQPPAIHKGDMHQRSEPGRAPVGPFEALRPTTFADYQKIAAEGGTRADIFEGMFGTPEVRRYGVSGREPQGLVCTDTNGVSWVSSDQGRTWLPELVTAQHVGEATAFALGDVVHFPGKSRRYVLATKDQFGRFDLVALSGGDRGSAPTGVGADEIEKDKDQTKQFVGVEAAKLQRMFRQYTSPHRMGFEKGEAWRGTIPTVGPTESVTEADAPPRPSRLRERILRTLQHGRFAVANPTEGPQDPARSTMQRERKQGVEGAGATLEVCDRDDFVCVKQATGKWAAFEHCRKALEQAGYDLSDTRHDPHDHPYVYVYESAGTPVILGGNPHGTLDPADAGTAKTVLTFVADQPVTEEPVPASADDTLTALRRIVQTGQHGRVPDPATGRASTVDATSAQAILAVHDGLTPTNRARLLQFSLPKMVDLAFKTLARAKAKTTTEAAFTDVTTPLTEGRSGFRHPAQVKAEREAVRILQQPRDAMKPEQAAHRAKATATLKRLGYTDAKIAALGESTDPTLDALAHAGIPILRQPRPDAAAVPGHTDPTDLAEARRKEGQKVKAGPGRNVGTIQGQPGKPWKKTIAGQTMYLVVFPNGTAQYMRDQDLTEAQEKPLRPLTPTDVEEFTRTALDAKIPQSAAELVGSVGHDATVRDVERALETLRQAKQARKVGTKWVRLKEDQTPLTAGSPPHPHTPASTPHTDGGRAGYYNPTAPTVAAPDPALAALRAEGILPPARGADTVSVPAEATLHVAKIAKVKMPDGTTRERVLREDEESAAQLAAGISDLRPYRVQGYRIVSEEEFHARMETEQAVAAPGEETEDGTVFTDYHVWLDQSDTHALLGQIVDFPDETTEYRIFGEDPGTYYAEGLDEAWTAQTSGLHPVAELPPALQKALKSLGSRGRQYIAGGRYKAGDTALTGWQEGTRESWYSVDASGHTTPMPMTLDPNRMGDPFKQRQILGDAPTGAIAVVKAREGGRTQIANVYAGPATTEGATEGWTAKEQKTIATAKARREWLGAFEALVRKANLPTGARLWTSAHAYHSQGLTPEQALAQYQKAGPKATAEAGEDWWVLHQDAKTKTWTMAGPYAEELAKAVEKDTRLVFQAATRAEATKKAEPALRRRGGQWLRRESVDEAQVGPVDTLDADAQARLKADLAADRQKGLSWGGSHGLPKVRPGDRVRVGKHEWLVTGAMRDAGRYEVGLVSTDYKHRPRNRVPLDAKDLTVVEAVEGDALTGPPVDFRTVPTLLPTEVDYTDGPVETQACEACTHFTDLGCTLVLEAAAPKGHCAKWEGAPTLDEAKFPTFTKAMAALRGAASADGTLTNVAAGDAVEKVGVPGHDRSAMLDMLVAGGLLKRAGTTFTITPAGASDKTVLAHVTAKRKR